METKEDKYVQLFMGTTYEIGNPKTIGQLKSKLENIISDLPRDPDLKIAEVWIHNGTLDYTLVKGIVQQAKHSK